MTVKWVYGCGTALQKCTGSVIDDSNKQNKSVLSQVLWLADNNRCPVLFAYSQSNFISVRWIPRIEIFKIQKSKMVLQQIVTFQQGDHLLKDYSTHQKVRFPNLVIRLRFPNQKDPSYPEQVCGTDHWLRVVCEKHYPLLRRVSRRWRTLVLILL